MDLTGKEFDKKAKQDKEKLSKAFDKANKITQSKQTMAEKMESYAAIASSLPKSIKILAGAVVGVALCGVWKIFELIINFTLFIINLF